MAVLNLNILPRNVSTTIYIYIYTHTKRIEMRVFRKQSLYFTEYVVIILYTKRVKKEVPVDIRRCSTYHTLILGG